MTAREPVPGNPFPRTWLIAAAATLVLACGFLGALTLGRNVPPARLRAPRLPVEDGAPPAPLPPPPPSAGVEVERGEGVVVEQVGEVLIEGLPSDPLPGEVSAWPADGRGVSGAVREAGPRMRRCYEAELARDPDLEATIVARFEISAVEGVGRVTGLTFETPAGHEGLDACVTEVLSDLAFDAPTESVLVTYPLVFSTVE